MVTRRRFVKKLTLASIGAFLGTQLFRLAAHAADKCGGLIDMSGKKSDETNKKAMAMAKNLGYVEDIDAAVKAKAATRKEKDDHCANCMFYVKVEDGKKCGTCKVIPIPGAQVTANGWCKSWVRAPKQG